MLLQSEVMAAMRILIICPNPPWVTGGIEKVVGEISKRLAKENDVTIYCNSNRDEEVIWNKVHIKTFTSIFGFIDLRMTKEIYQNSAKFDLIHAHGSGTLIPIEAAFFSKNSPVVFSLYYHPSGKTKILNLLKKIYDPLLLRRALERGKLIFCVSEAEKELVKDAFLVGKRRVEVIPHGINLDLIKNFKNYKINEYRNIILYVGRLERYKNISYIINALKYLPDNYILYIIGEGPFKEKLIERAKYEGVLNKTKFLGRVSDEALYFWLNTASIVMNLSSIESFGITVIEALAAGKPVIVNDKLGLSELAKTFEEITAIDVEHVSIDELAKFIEKCSNKNHHYVGLEQYDWDNIAKMYFNLYCSIDKILPQS